MEDIQGGEDIKILESIVKVHNKFLKGCKKETISDKEIQALEHLIKEYKKYKNIARKEYDEHMEKKRQNAVLENNQLILQREIEKKDKIIEAMAEQLTTPIHNKEWVIEYFTKEVEREVEK